MNAKSRFVWHDLNTTDLAAAQRFYGELFHWRCETDKSGYVMIKNGDKQIGGMRKQEANEGPPSWMGYLSVDDVEAATKTIAQKGGRVIMPAKKIDGMGSFAVCADPMGAVFALWKNATEMQEPQGRAGTHNFCWDELSTTDVDKAIAFYTQAFGWGVERVDMGPSGIYSLLKRTGITDETGRVKDAGGVMKSPAPMSYWGTYVAVEKCDATVDKATKMGSKIFMKPTDIPNVGRFAALADPQGAAFSILQPKL
jgi:predicted enzyme related to lactoylglutathione lyase